MFTLPRLVPAGDRALELASSTSRPSSSRSAKARYDADRRVRRVVRLQQPAAAPARSRGRDRAWPWRRRRRGTARDSLPTRTPPRRRVRCAPSTCARPARAVVAAAGQPQDVRSASARPRPRDRQHRRVALGRAPAASWKQVPGRQSMRRRVLCLLDEQPATFARPGEARHERASTAGTRRLLAGVAERQAGQDGPPGERLLVARAEAHAPAPRVAAASARRPSVAGCRPPTPRASPPSPRPGGSAQRARYPARSSAVGAVSARRRCSRRVADTDDAPRAAGGEQRMAEAGSGRRAASTIPSSRAGASTSHGSSGSSTAPPALRWSVVPGCAQAARAWSVARVAVVQGAGGRGRPGSQAAVASACPRAAASSPRASSSASNGFPTETSCTQARSSADSTTPSLLRTIA